MEEKAKSLKKACYELDTDYPSLFSMVNGARFIKKDGVELVTLDMVKDHDGEYSDWTITIEQGQKIPLWIIEAKHNKIKEESLYDKLKRLCNPANFIKGGNYDKEKVDKANVIYKRLMEITAEDKEALEEIRLQAVADLSIILIDSEKLADLKEKVNPKNYLTPYNAEKVALANELFAILSKDGLTYDDFVDVEEKSKQL